MTVPPTPAAHAETATAADPVSEGRGRIDALDAQILRLLAERTEASRRIQAARVAAGGGRISHSREIQIVDRYARELGRPGSRIALAVLELGRGRA